MNEWATEEFKRELTSLINRFSVENGSDTPDFIIADYLMGCLESFEKAVNRRTSWFDKGATK